MLKAVVAKTGAVIHYSVLPDEPITATCADNSVKQVIECLLSNRVDRVYRKVNNAAPRSTLIKTAVDREEIWILGARYSTNDATPLYPASYTNRNIISVAALNSMRHRSSLSNFGKKSVDIAAPFVTGAVAMYAHFHPHHHKAENIKHALLRSAEPTDDFKDNTVSGGRLNIPALLGMRH